jgi:hypothetical protein
MKKRSRHVVTLGTGVRIINLREARSHTPYVVDSLLSLL